MQTIGFKNFRRFEELTPLELAGITFFVGGNNAGKSTVVKAMMLMLDNIARNSIYSNEASSVFQLGSEGGKNVHIGTFGRALHKPYPEVQEIEFESQVRGLTFRYVIGGDVESQRLSADVHIFEVQDKEQKWLIRVDYYEGVINFISPESVINGVSNKSIQSRLRSGVGLSIDIQSMLDQIDIELKSLREKAESADEIKRVVFERDIKQREAQRKALQAQIGLSSDQKKDEVMINEELHFTKEDILNEPRILVLLSKLFENKREEAKELLNNTDSSNTRVKCETLIKQYDGIEGWLSYLRQQIRSLAYKAMMEYIPSHSVAQRIFFSREDRNDYMSDVIGKFQAQNYTDASEQRHFVQKWMNNFGIGLDFKIESIQGEAFTVTVTNMQGEDVPLADLGMGSIQIILLLLKLATLMSAGPVSRLVIVEEPEQNIHPKLQSKLAELFEYVHRECGIRFLIETHSEYMIRKTQAMIATGAVQFENNPFRVYYFPENGTPYDMVYQQSGMFENKFDEGFFDEASKQQFSVIKKAREIQHV